MNTLSNATHAVLLDHFTGQGAMVLPTEADDLHLSGMDTLNSAGWDDMVRTLRKMGWTPLLDDETGDLSVMGQTKEGRTVVNLYASDSIISRPSLDQMVRAYDGLRDALGVA